MAREITKGIELLDDIEGSGEPSTKGARIKYCVRMFLRKGDEITLDAEMIRKYPEHLSIVEIEGEKLIEHTLELGKRRAIAGVEKALIGMKKNGYREVMVAPHLAYGEEGVPGKVPANALLRLKLWVRAVNIITQPGTEEPAIDPTV